jgi:hypothetical protein
MPRRKPWQRKLQPRLRECGRPLLQLPLLRRLVWLRNPLRLLRLQSHLRLSLLRNRLLPPRLRLLRHQARQRLRRLLLQRRPLRRRPLRPR